MNARTRTKGELPFLLVNMAMTADGKIATANRRVSSFGSSRDKKNLLRLRTTADAVMAGARTIDSNEVNLGPGPAKHRKLRVRHGLAEYNLRIIVSRSGSIDPKAHIFTKRFSPIIILTTRRVGEERLALLREIADEVRICGEKEIEWADTLSWLRKEWKVKRLLCEGGGELNDALFRGGFVDELHLTICPLIFGGRTAPTVSDGQGAEKLAQAVRLELRQMRRIGGELFLVFRRGRIAVPGGLD